MKDLEFYSRPVGMTNAGKYTAALKKLPDDIGELCRIVQGLIVHEFVASSMYGIEPAKIRKNESHLRRVEDMIGRILEIDSEPLTVQRPPEKRLVGVCHHFMLLLVAILRAKSVPSRARCGFGSYFNPGFFEDHWVAEYWEAGEKRWVLVDPQFDEIWRKHMHSDHNVLDVPRDRFLVAGDAWRLCRAGKEDASRFGIVRGNLRGLWFIATDIVHDVAALNKVELLPWDVWGAAPKQDERLGEDQLAFFDNLANITSDPDENFEELRAIYKRDELLRVPRTVFNAILNRPEKVDRAVSNTASA